MLSIEVVSSNTLYKETTGRQYLNLSISSPRHKGVAILVRTPYVCNKLLHICYSSHQIKNVAALWTSLLLLILLAVLGEETGSE